MTTPTTPAAPAAPPPQIEIDDAPEAVARLVEAFVAAGSAPAPPA
jgi:hypothetical protein